MLTNLETFTEKLLQIVLVGQPELEQKLKQPQLRQLRQALTLRAKTHALTLDETKAYVQQRLRIAGSNGQQIFDPEALVSIHRYASGIPRVINLLCEHCLVSAFVDQQKVIAPTVVDSVAKDFDLGDNTTSGALPRPATEYEWRQIRFGGRPAIAGYAGGSLAAAKRKTSRRKETMSRIHEALKKAEQERAASQGVSPQPNLATTPVTEPAGVHGRTCAVVPSPSMAHSAMPAFASTVQHRHSAGTLRAAGMESGYGNHVVHEWRR